MVYGRVVVGAAVLAGLLTTPAFAQKAEDIAKVPLRSFERFELDSGTVSGLWIEVGSALKHDVEHDRATATKTSTSVNTTAVRAAYGGEYFEVGAFFPYVINDVDVDVNGVCQPARDVDGIGDIRVYGKAMPLRTEYADAGVGYEAFLPSGDEDNGIGTGQIGQLFFATGAIRLGNSKLQGHFGYREYDLPETKYAALAPDSYFYGGGLYTPLNDRLALRGEFVGQSIELPGVDADAIEFQPGVDLRIPYKTFDLVVRPTGMIGVNDSPDWGVGGSLAVTWNPAGPAAAE